MASLMQEQIEVAKEFVDLTIAALQDEKGVHAETAIASAGRMAGTFLFRSFGFPLVGVTPGQAVLSEAANERGPQLVELLGSLLQQLGVAIDPRKVTGKADPEHEPLRVFLDTQRLLENVYTAAARKRQLTLGQSSEAAVIAAALLISQCRQVLEPARAFELAIYGIVEGSKTAPDPVKL